MGYRINALEMCNNSSTKIENRKQSIEKKQSYIDAKKRFLKKKYNIESDSDLDNFKNGACWYEIYWNVCEIKRLQEDIEELNKSISKLTDNINNSIQFCDDFATFEHIMDILPEEFSLAEKELSKQWTEFDLNESETKDKFVINEIKSGNDEAARVHTINFYNKIVKVVGEPVEWDIKQNGPTISGSVIGTSGEATLKCCIAGGYNVQRLHIRTSVKPKKGKKRDE